MCVETQRLETLTRSLLGMYCLPSTLCDPRISQSLLFNASSHPCTPLEAPLLHLLGVFCPKAHFTPATQRSPPQQSLPTQSASPPQALSTFSSSPDLSCPAAGPVQPSLALPITATPGSRGPALCRGGWRWQHLHGPLHRPGQARLLYTLAVNTHPVLLQVCSHPALESLSGRGFTSGSEGVGPGLSFLSHHWIPWGHQSML